MVLNSARGLAFPCRKRDKQVFNNAGPWKEEKDKGWRSEAQRNVELRCGRPTGQAPGLGRQLIKSGRSAKERRVCTANNSGLRGEKERGKRRGMKTANDLKRTMSENREAKKSCEHELKKEANLTLESKKLQGNNT